MKSIKWYTFMIIMALSSFSDSESSFAFLNAHLQGSGRQHLARHIQNRLSIFLQQRAAFQGLPKINQTQPWQSANFHLISRNRSLTAYCWYLTYVAICKSQNKAWKNCGARRRRKRLQQRAKALPVRDNGDPKPPQAGMNWWCRSMNCSPMETEVRLLWM